MRTNIVLDDDLVSEAFQYAGNIRTKRELIEVALEEFVVRRKAKKIGSDRALKELLTGINKGNIHHEVDTGPAVGNEIQ